MKIRGLQPFTLMDFPGRAAAVLFTQGCNLRCPFCHNSQLWAPDAPACELMPESLVLQWLGQRKRLLDGVVLSGGEPTLQPDLPAFITRIKALSLAVKLDTNGTRPAVLRGLLDSGGLDYVAMDLKAPLDAYDRLAGAPVDRAVILESVGLVASSGVAHEFRTTYAEPLLTEQDIAAIRTLVPQGSPYRVQAFVAAHAMDSGLRELARVS